MADDFLVHWVDLAIVITGLEVAGLAAYHRWTGRGVSLADVGMNLLSGLMLMLALRSAVGGAAAPWTMAFLLAAGVAHGSDLWRRWPR